MASLIIIQDGVARCVYDDRFRPLLEALGALRVRRATEVEYDPQGGEWIAFHLQSRQIIARGRDRNQVIAAEVAWLETHGIPVAAPPVAAPPVAAPPVDDSAGGAALPLTAPA